MKRVFIILSSGLALLVVACGPTHVVVQSETPVYQAPPPRVQDAPAPPPAITYQTFYDALSPYGQWVDYPGTGYVWIPNAGPDFKPYSTAGHWVYSNEGWTWVSDYPWGWATFHYGRWFFDDNYGWCWVPGYQWAPAWVAWRQSPDYYGWAPLAPTVGGSVSISSYTPPAHVWSFVPQQYVTSPHVNNYYVEENKNVTIINRTTVINNYNTVNRITNNNTTINNTTINNVHNTTNNTTNNVTNNTTNNNITNNNVTNNNINNTNITNNKNVYVTGPARTEVEAATHTTITPVTFKEGATPGGSQVNNGQLTIYRPQVKTPPPATSGQSTPAPAKVVPLNTVRPITPPAGQVGSTPNNQGNPPPAQRNKEMGYPASNPPGGVQQQVNSQQNENAQQQEQTAQQKAAQLAAQQKAAQLAAQQAAQQKAAQLAAQQAAQQKATQLAAQQTAQQKAAQLAAQQAAQQKAAQLAAQQKAAQQKAAQLKAAQLKRAQQRAADSARRASGNN